MNLLFSRFSAFSLMKITLIISSTSDGLYKYCSLLVFAMRTDFFVPDFWTYLKCRYFVGWTVFVVPVNRWSVLVAAV